MEQATQAQITALGDQDTAALRDLHKAAGAAIRMYGNRGEFLAASENYAEMLYSIDGETARRLLGRIVTDAAAAEMNA